jgi:hypothetical protein
MQGAAAMTLRSQSKSERFYVQRADGALLKNETGPATWTDEIDEAWFTTDRYAAKPRADELGAKVLPVRA